MISERFELEDCYVVGGMLFGRIMVIVHAERETATHHQYTARRALRKTNMKKEDEEANEVDDMQPEYDFSNGVRGKYYRPGKTIIRITVDEDAGLRTLIAEGRSPEPRDE